MSTTLATLAAAALASTMGSAIVVQDSAALRAAPKDATPASTVLWQGDIVEVRGESLDYVQIWDHRRERGGYVKASDLRRISLTPERAPELLSVLRFFQATPGAESLSIGLAAAYVQAASPEDLAGAAGAQAMHALGTAAQGLAQRAMAQSMPSANAGASTGMAAPSASAQARAIALTGQMDAASAYGVKLLTYAANDAIQVCYDGTAFRQLLLMPKATPEQRVDAALALTQPQCIAPDLTPADRAKVLQDYASILDNANATTVAGYLRTRLQVRRAATWSALAFQQMRRTAAATSATTATNTSPAIAMATRALTEFTSIAPTDIADADWPDYNDAAMRINAVRWALVPPVAAAAASASTSTAATSQRPTLHTEPGTAPGQTCIVLKASASAPANTPALARQCTYGIVWQASATMNPEGNAMTVAVQPLEGWRELWVLRKTEQGWIINTLPPAPTTPALGYAEWAGWVPGGQRMLVAREARGQGRYYRRTFEVVQLDGLTTEHQAGSASALPLFQRWQDANWKRLSLSLR